MSIDPAAKYRPPATLRCYTMLEQRTLAEVVREAYVNAYQLNDATEAVIDELAKLDTPPVYVSLGPRDARNADHAYRQVVKERFGDAPGTLNLVAVARKMWKPKPVANNVRYYVSVG